MEHVSTSTVPEPRFSAVPLILALGFVVATTLLSPWSRDLFVGDETRYGRVVHEMETTGDYLVPRLNGSPYSHKPPVHFWTVIAARKLTGATGTAPFVVPSLVGYLLSIGLTWWIGTRRFGRFPGLCAALAMAGFWLSWGSAQSARMDLTYCWLVMLAIVAVWKHLDTGHTRPALLGGFLTGAAVLVKGPMALPIVITFFVIESIRRRVQPKLAALGGLLVSLAITAIWLLPAIISGGDEYGREMIVDQSIGRAFSAWVHAAPPWFYLLRSPVLFFPWMPLLAIALFVAWRQRKGGEKGNSPMPVFSWFLAVFLPYSLISSKLDVYMILALPPAALLIGWWCSREQSRTAIRWNAIGVAFVMALIGLVANLAVPFLDANDPDIAPWLVPEVRSALWLTTVVCLGTGFLLLSVRDRPRAMAFTAFSAVAPLALLLWFALDVINEESSTVRLNRALEATRVSPERISMHWTPYLWGRDLDPSLHHVHYGFPSESPVVPELVVVREDHTDDLGDELDAYRKSRSVRMISKQFDIYRRSVEGE